jgi:hypothetical protein
MHEREGDVLELDPTYTLVHPSVRSVHIAAEHDTGSTSIQQIQYNDAYFGLEGEPLSLIFLCVCHTHWSESIRNSFAFALAL